MKLMKFFISLIFVLSITSFALTAVLFTVRENEKARRIELEYIKAALEEQVSALEVAKREGEEKITSLQAELSKTAQDLQLKQSEVEKLKQEFQKTKQAAEASDAQISELQKAIELSQDRNQELERMLETLEKNLQQMKQGQPATSDALTWPGSPTDQTAVQGAAGSTEMKSAEEAPQASSTFTIVEEKPRSSEIAQASVSAGAETKPILSESIQAGRVLLVNRKFNFVIINMGTNQGLKVGDTFAVSEGGQKIAKVQIEKLYDDYSAAKIAEMTGDQLLLKEGNLVARV